MRKQEYIRQSAAAPVTIICMRSPGRSDYEKLCPWADVIQSGKTWPDELTDAAVELFECEKNNREQRRKRRKDQ